MVILIFLGRDFSRDGSRVVGVFLDSPLSIPLFSVGSEVGKGERWRKREEGRGKREEGRGKREEGSMDGCAGPRMYLILAALFYVLTGYPIYICIHVCMYARELDVYPYVAKKRKRDRGIAYLQVPFQVYKLFRPAEGVGERSIVSGQIPAR